MPITSILFPKKVLIAAACIFMSSSISSYAATEIKVVGYHFPPFVDDYGGLTPKLIDGLNDLQSDYNFVFTKTTPARRYRDLETGRGDIIFFEMAKWGWSQSPTPVEETREILTGKEVYLALRKPGRDQTFFKNLSSKRIAAIAGYHYGFANFNADPKWLKQNFDISLTQNHTTNIRILQAERVDLSIVNMSYLQKFFKENPDLRSKVLISEKRDQTYHLKALIRKGSPIKAAKLEKILSQAKDHGLFDHILKFYGLSEQFSF